MQTLALDPDEVHWTDVRPWMASRSWFFLAWCVAWWGSFGVLVVLGVRHRRRRHRCRPLVYDTHPLPHKHQA